MSRERKKNFQDVEITKLLEMYKENADLLNSRNVNGHLMNKKREVWQAITDGINAVGDQTRTVAEVRHKWKDLLFRAKKDYNWQINRKRTIERVGPYSQVVLELLGEGISSNELDDEDEQNRFQEEDGLNATTDSKDGLDSDESISDCNEIPAANCLIFDPASRIFKTMSASSSVPTAKRKCLNPDENDSVKRLQEELYHQEIKKCQLEQEKIILEKTKLLKEIKKLDIEITQMKQHD